MKIQLRLRRKRRVAPVKVQTFKDLHARGDRKGSASDRAVPITIAPHTNGQDDAAAGSQAGHDVVINHVLV